MDNNNNYRPDDYGDGFYVDDRTVRTSTEYQDNNEADIDPDYDDEAPAKKHGLLSKLIKVLIITIVIIICAVVAYSAVILMRVKYTGIDPDHGVSTSQGIELMSMDGVENIVIFGEDNHAEDSHGRSDSIILLTIDHNHKKLKQTSLMRDIYLEIPGEGYNKLNAAYAIGGAALAVETIEYNFHIRIDDYIIIDFNSFTDIIDSLGGLDMVLTYEEVEYIDWQSYRNKQTEEKSELNADSYTYTTNSDGERITTVHLNGRQALWYARNRDSAGSDFDRTWRQRGVVDAVLSKIKGSDPFRIAAAGMSASQYVSTNMQPFTLTGKAASVFSALGWEREQYRLPRWDNYYDQWTDNAGLALMISDMDKARNELYDFVFGEDRKAE